MTKSINITLNVWRQKGAEVKGGFETYHAANISTDMSFLEMIDVVNEQLTLDGRDPIAFDHDCREGICGMCGAVVNGRAHGPEKGTTLCQLHMRHFSRRRYHRHRALACQGISHDKGSCGGSQRL